MIEREYLVARWRGRPEALVDAIDYCRRAHGVIVIREPGSIMIELRDTPAQLDAAAATMPQEGLVHARRERRHRVPHFFGLECKRGSARASSCR